MPHKNERFQNWIKDQRLRFSHQQYWIDLSQTASFNTRKYKMKLVNRLCWYPFMIHLVLCGSPSPKQVAQLNFPLPSKTKVTANSTFLMVYHARICLLPPATQNRWQILISSFFLLFLIVGKLKSPLPHENVKIIGK